MALNRGRPIAWVLIGALGGTAACSDAVGTNQGIPAELQMDAWLASDANSDSTVDALASTANATEDQFYASDDEVWAFLVARIAAEAFDRTTGGHHADDGSFDPGSPELQSTMAANMTTVWSEFLACGMRPGERDAAVALSVLGCVDTQVQSALATADLPSFPVEQPDPVTPQLTWRVIGGRLTLVGTAAWFGYEGGGALAHWTNRDLIALQMMHQGAIEQDRQDRADFRREIQREIEALERIQRERRARRDAGM